MNKVVSFLFIAFLLISCSEYQKALKSDDVAVKSEAANKMYDGIADCLKKIIKN